MKLMKFIGLFSFLLQGIAAYATPFDGCTGQTFRCGEQCQGFNAPCGNDSSIVSESSGKVITAEGKDYSLVGCFANPVPSCESDGQKIMIGSQDDALKNALNACQTAHVTQLGQFQDSCVNVSLPTRGCGAIGTSRATFRCDD